MEQSKSDIGYLTPKEYLEDLIVAVQIDSESGYVLSYNDKVDRLYMAMKSANEIELPTVHRITPGLYTRECTAPAGTLLISKTHLTDHQFILSKGVVYTIDGDGEIVKSVAPVHGETKAGARRVVYVEEDAIMTTMHSTNETEVSKIEGILYKEDSLRLSDNPDHISFLQAAKDIGVDTEQIRIESERFDTMTDMPEGFGDKIEVRPSTIHGFGLFASENFGAFEMIAPAAINSKRTVAGRFTNHSANPNAMLHAEPNGKVNLISISQINKDSEITLDYRQARSAAMESLMIRNT